MPNLANSSSEHTGMIITHLEVFINVAAQTIMELTGPEYLR